MRTTTEEIDRYISGDMTAQECISFEARLREDERLRAELQLQLTMVDAIQKCGQQDDMDVIEGMKVITPKELRAIIGQKKSVRSRVIYFSLAVAAIMFLLLSIRFFNDYRSAGRIYDEFYTGRIDEVIYRGSHENDDFIRALTLWEQGERKTSISLLEAIVAQGDINPYYQDASWNLGLFYLKTHKLKKAKKILKKIVMEGGYYSEKAQLILER